MYLTRKEVCRLIELYICFYSKLHFNKYKFVCVNSKYKEYLEFTHTNSYNYYGSNVSKVIMPMVF